MARQHGVISRRQLIGELGWSTSKFGRYRAAGILVHVAPGVVRMASDRPTFESMCMATQLTANGVGFVSSWSAGRLAGLRRMPRLPVHYTGPTSLQIRFPDWVEAHRSRWYDESDVVVRPDELRVATPLRALFGMAAAFNQFRFERAAEDAWHLGLIDARRCRGLPRTPPVPREGRRVDDGTLAGAMPGIRPTGPDADWSRTSWQSSTVSGLPPPVRQYPLALQNGESIHFDIAWPDVRLAVEPGHSWWHGGDLRQRLDQDRDRGMQRTRLARRPIRRNDAARRCRRRSRRCGASTNGARADLRNVLSPTR